MHCGRSWRSMYESPQSVEQMVKNMYSVPQLEPTIHCTDRVLQSSRIRVSRPAPPAPSMLCVCHGHAWLSIAFGIRLTSTAY
jgi:hypothetical protein